MNKRELRELEFSKKTYEHIPTAEMAERVSDIEKSLSAGLTMWDDEEIYAKYKAINQLNLSDRRLVIVYSLLGGSVVRTAAYFSVSRKTIDTNINRIKQILGLC